MWRHATLTEHTGTPWPLEHVVARYEGPSTKIRQTLADLCSLLQQPSRNAQVLIGCSVLTVVWNLKQGMQIEKDLSPVSL